MKPREIPRQALFAANLNCDCVSLHIWVGGEETGAAQTKIKIPLEFKSQFSSMNLKHEKTNSRRTFLVVQWMGVYLPMQGHGLNPWFRKTPHAIWQLSLCLRATPTEPTCCTYWSLCVYSLCFTTREATGMRGLCTEAKRSPCSLQLKKDQAKQQRLSTAGNKWLINQKKKRLS